MSDRIRHTNAAITLNEPDARAAHTTDHKAIDHNTIGGNATAILVGSQRLVLKNGRLAGGRACALSARAATRIQTLIPSS
jgi:hypothetical protein